MRLFITLFVLINLIFISQDQASECSIPLMYIAHEVVKALHLNPHPDSLEQLLSENIQFYAKTDDANVAIQGREDLMRNFKEKHNYDTQQLSIQELYYNCSIDEVYYKSIPNNGIGLYIKWNMQNKEPDPQEIDSADMYKLETLTTLIFEEDPNAELGYTISEFHSEYNTIPID